MGDLEALLFASLTRDEFLQGQGPLTLSPNGVFLESVEPATNAAFPIGFLE